MQKLTPPFIILFATGLLFWLVWGFWSLGQALSLFITLCLVILSGLVLFWYYQQQRKPITLDAQTLINKLPKPGYQGAIVLVCGQSDALFTDEIDYRETTQGWYIPVATPMQLTPLVQTVAHITPALLNQLSVLYVLLPEHATLSEQLAQDVLNWRRAIGESRQQVSRQLPFWLSVYLSPINTTFSPVLTDNLTLPWLVLLKQQTQFQVIEENQLTVPLAAWFATHYPDDQAELHHLLWFDILLAWLNQQFIPLLTVTQTGAPVLMPSAWAIQSVNITSQRTNLWQQFVEHKTGLLLAPHTQDLTLLPLPDVVLRHLYYDVTLTYFPRLIGVLGIVCGLFLLGALIGSYQHNRQLIVQIGENTQHFLTLPDTPLLAKQAAYQQLQHNAITLSRWAREGEPAAYSLALYQGKALLPYLQRLLAGWAPPSPVMVQDLPQVISLSNLALFDVGQSALKPSATDVLIKALLQIQAKSGWLIVVSGYTDNTGNVTFNQKLSLLRAESVRDWLIAASDIDPACFAVQGYGQHHPIADNTSAQGRARNRRVEIRLMPQAEACQTSRSQNVSSMDNDTPLLIKEK